MFDTFGIQIEFPLAQIALSLLLANETINRMRRAPRCSFILTQPCHCWKGSISSFLFVLRFMQTSSCVFDEKSCTMSNKWFFKSFEKDESIQCH